MASAAQNLPFTLSVIQSSVTRCRFRFLATWVLAQFAPESALTITWVTVALTLSETLPPWNLVRAHKDLRSSRWREEATLGQRIVPCVGDRVSVDRNCVEDEALI